MIKGLTKSEVVHGLQWVYTASKNTSFHSVSLEFSPLPTREKGFRKRKTDVNPRVYLEFIEVI